MPYRNGHFYVGFVLLVVVSGFWVTYFQQIDSVPLAFHVHAFTATSWLLLLIAQSVAIHRRANALHKLMGRASFVLFPLLLLGFAMIIDVSANRYASGESEFIAYVGPSFAIGMGIAIAAYLVLFYQALRHRRNVKLHAGYMLATPLILFESPVSRLIGQFFPWMNVIGSEGIQGMLDTIVVGNALATIFALAVYLRDRKNGAPWLVAAGFTVAQSAAMWFAPGLPLLPELFRAYAAVPTAITLLAALAMGGAAGWLGWRAVPGAGQRRAATAPA
jgi:hypothetical protein